MNGGTCARNRKKRMCNNVVSDINGQLSVGGPIIVYAADSIISMWKGPFIGNGS